MKRKAFIVTLLSFIVLINSNMLLVSLISLRESMATKREKALTEHYVISSGLIGDMQALENRGGDVKESVSELMRTYGRYSQNRENELAVSCGSEWVYASGGEMPQAAADSLAAQIERSERIFYTEKEPALRMCVYGRFPAPFQEYGLLYRADLGDMLETWRSMKNMLFTVSMAVSFLFALFLMKFLDILFKPLREISAASRVIAAGDYHIRLCVRGQDEIAVMADNFNLMAEQVESHIHLLQDTANRKQRFVDNFAHELRTPLTSIYGYAEYMLKAPVAEEERLECLHFILAECTRLQNMAYQLLDLAALREVETGKCPVAELFGRALGIMKVKAEKRGIALSCQCGQEVVAGNRELLITVLGNLIDNALKASSAGSVVRLLAVLEGDEVILEVADEGIGMTEEHLAHIKEAFYRADKSRSREAGGAGLGLSICEQIVKQHHGRLAFLSKPGEGTRARVVLPRAD